MTVSRPPMKYRGGKWRIAPWVIDHFPSHTTYVECFGGGGSVLLRKPRSKFEVYNDLDSQVVNLFRMLRERPEELAQIVGLTPYSREECKLSDEQTEDPLENARRFLIKGQMSLGATGPKSGSSWRFFVGQIPAWKDLPHHILQIAERLLDVQIENSDAIKLLAYYDDSDTLFYCDPPYSAKERKSAGEQYSCEMTESDHHALSVALREVKGSVVLSGYDNSMYNLLYKDWKTDTTQTHTMTAGRADGKATTATEKLWIKYSESALIQQRLI